MTLCARKIDVLSGEREAAGFMREISYLIGAIVTVHTRKYPVIGKMELHKVGIVVSMAGAAGFLVELVSPLCNICMALTAL
jgi:hypothetical protein